MLLFSDDQNCAEPQYVINRMLWNQTRKNLQSGFGPPGSHDEELLFLANMPVRRGEDQRRAKSSRHQRRVEAKSENGRKPNPNLSVSLKPGEGRVGAELRTKTNIMLAAPSPQKKETHQSCCHASPATC